MEGTNPLVPYELTIKTRRLLAHQTLNGLHLVLKKEVTEPSLCFCELIASYLNQTQAAFLPLNVRNWQEAQQWSTSGALFKIQCLPEQLA